MRYTKRCVGGSIYIVEGMVPTGNDIRRPAIAPVTPDHIAILYRDGITAGAAIDGVVVGSGDVVTVFAAVDVVCISSIDRILAAGTPDAAVKVCFNVVVVRTCIDVGMLAGFDAVVPGAAAD